MTEEQRKLCRDLIIFPNGRSQITKEEFLRRFPSAVEHGRLALKWLQEAYETRNADDLSYAFIIGGTFGYVPEHKDILRRLIDEDWHYSHEGVVSALQTWPTPDTVEALFRATQWIPKSLEYDDHRALAVKAIWALGRIPGQEAEKKLEVLARSDNPILKRNAEEQLKRRQSAA
ncbi:MAG TPA: HEAT repeat domain-containing protein [Verrucomicrobiae bacterium]|nr:HEAT repeat domain-containing protein [Verrucomicrobiae bacterium]